MWGCHSALVLFSPLETLDFAAVAAQGDQLARVLGPEWQALRYSQLLDKACRLEQTVSFTRLLGRYMLETATETAGEALARLQATQGDAAEWERDRTPGEA
jgi:hypothetical protein